jgi:hypothetical protein
MLLVWEWVLGTKCCRTTIVASITSITSELGEKWKKWEQIEEREFKGVQGCEERLKEEIQ